MKCELSGELNQENPFCMYVHIYTYINVYIIIPGVQLNAEAATLLHGNRLRRPVWSIRSALTRKYAR